MNPIPTPMSSTDSDELRDSEVLRILKRRVYHGARHDTKLEDLKKASKEILDWVDSTIATHDAALKDQLYEQLLVQFSGRVEVCKTDGEVEISQRLYRDFHKAINQVFGKDTSKGEQK